MEAVTRTWGCVLRKHVHDDLFRIALARRVNPLSAFSQKFAVRQILARFAIFATLINSAILRRRFLALCMLSSERGHLWICRDRDCDSFFRWT